MRCIGVIGLVLAIAAPPVFAHAFLERANPPVGSEITASPSELSMTFSEGVEPLFSTIELHDSKGSTVTTSKPHTTAGNDRQLVVGLPKLPPGTYVVIWHATSVDTHKTEGNYKFTVLP